VSTILKSKKITINLLKNKSCDICGHYASNGLCYSTNRLVNPIIYEKINEAILSLCPKEGICEYYVGV